MAKTKRSPRTAGRRYVLELSERQAELVSRATELYARLGTGQFDKLERFFWSPKDALERARLHFDSLRLIHTGSLTAYPGIHSKSVDDDYRVLYDLHQVIRHRLAWDRDPEPQGVRGVFYDRPLRASESEPLAAIVSVSGENAAKGGKP